MKITREEKRDMMITLNTYGQGRVHDVAFENKLELDWSNLENRDEKLKMKNRNALGRSWACESVTKRDGNTAFGFHN